MRQHYPQVQAISLFGSYAQGTPWPQSDVDLAVLLPAVLARKESLMALSPCVSELSHQLQRDIDLINLRQVNTVFQNEIIHTGRWIDIQDEEAVLAFEMMVLSAHQKLNEERADILKSFLETKRAYKL
ncbi:MAG: nucleotidyltransferase domain-containing protein [Deinococcota bacterium]